MSDVVESLSREAPSSRERETRTLADDLRYEDEALQRRFIHHTRPRGPMSMNEAMALCERVAKVGT